MIVVVLYILVVFTSVIDSLSPPGPWLEGPDFGEVVKPFRTIRNTLFSSYITSTLGAFYFLIQFLGVLQ